MINKDRAKPRELNPSVKRLIYYRAITQRKIPRVFLANQLIKEIEDAGEIAPTLETAKRYISKARNSDNPIDKPWTLACCSEYASFFPPESIPIIIKYKELLGQIEGDAEYQEVFGDSMSDIPIRVAMWIVRLKPAIEHLTPKLMINNEPIPELYPFAIANAYAMAEMASEMLGENHFDSTDMDKALLAGAYRTLMTIAGIMSLATSKPCKNNGDCESCDHFKIPGTGLCIPKRKESE